MDDSTTQEVGAKYTALPNLNISDGVVNLTGSDIDVTVENMNGTGGTVNLAADLIAEEGKQAGKFNVKKAEANASLDVKLMDSALERELTADELNIDQAEAWN